jgi:DNA polymerase-3 subunit gamma/tau
VLAHVPAAARDGLLDVSPEQGERLAGQAARFGAADLVRAAEVVATALGEIRGATAPRLLLELMCARVLLPAADDGLQGVQARLDRIERRMAIAGVEHPRPARPEPRQPARAPAPASPPPSVPPTAVAPVSGAEAPEPGRPAGPAATEPAPEQLAPEPARLVAETPGPVTAAPAAEPSAAARPAAPQEAETPGTASPETDSPEPSQATSAATGLGLLDVRRAWPDVVERTKSARRLAWSLLSQSAQVHALDGSTLTVAFVNAGSRDSFARNGCDEVLRQVLIDVLGVDWRVECIVDPSTTPASPSPSSTAAASTGNGPAPAPADVPTAQARPDPAARRGSGSGAAESRTTSPASSPASAAATEGAHLDDDDVADGGDTHELLSRELGAQVIEEIPHQP